MTLLLHFFLSLAAFFHPMPFPSFQVNAAARFVVDDAPDCTITAVARHENYYLFVTADHCLPGSKFVAVYATVTVPLQLIFQGVRMKGEDIAVFIGHSLNPLPVIPLAQVRHLHIAESVSYAGWSAMLGSQWYEGQISLLPGNGFTAPDLYSPTDQMNWTNDIMVSIGGGPGASGSLLSADGQGIAILVGAYNQDSNIFFNPIPQDVISLERGFLNGKKMDSTRR